MGGIKGILGRVDYKQVAQFWKFILRKVEQKKPFEYREIDKSKWYWLLITNRYHPRKHQLLLMILYLKVIFQEVFHKTVYSVDFLLPRDSPTTFPPLT